MAQAMKKSDTQHLDFLVSQYVDGCLEGANKKTVEQQMLNDPAARALYTDHRDVQDLLDDWGNRIPMIDWADFEKKLDARLEKEVQEQQRVSIFRRRLRPFAAAAVLLLAVGLGYGWHAMTSGTGTGAPGGNTRDFANAAGPADGVQFPDMAPRSLASRHELTVVEPAAHGLSSGSSAALTMAPPDDSEAAQSLMDTLALGIRDLPPAQEPRRGSVAGSSAAPIQDLLPVDEKELR